MKKDFEFIMDILTNKHKPPQNTEKGSDKAAENTAPQNADKAEDQAPVASKPEEAVSVEKAPEDTASADTAPMAETPAEKVPEDTAAQKDAPVETAPGDTAPTDETAEEDRSKEFATTDSAPAEPTSTDATDAAGDMKKSNKKPIVITAAAVVIIALIVGIIIAVIANANPLKAVELPGDLTLRQFESRDQVTEELSRLQKKNNQEAQKLYDDTVGKYATDAGLSEEGDSKAEIPNIAGIGEELVEAFSDTFNQVMGVDEADTVKTDGKYIYCIDSDYSDKDVVEIFKADGKDSKKAAQINIFTDDAAATPDSAAKKDEADRWDYYAAYRSINDIYVKDNRLIVIGSDSTPHNGSTATRTVTKIYDVSDIDNIKLLDTITQSGKSKSTHMIDDTLYLVSTYTPFDSASLPFCGRGEAPDELAADSIYTLQDNKTERFIVLSAVNTRDLKAKTESKAILGDVKDVYCNEDNMYLYADFGEKKKQSFLFGLFNSEVAVKSQILKLDMADGVNFIAYTKLDGVIDSSYSLDEYDGNLRVATTTSNGDSETDYLYVLDKELTTIGSLNNFAPDEYLAAIRYVGDTAYVVAYDLVNPLFTIDLSTPEQPALKGKTDLGGFAAMLVPVDDHTLLGLGYESMGVGDLVSEDATKEGFKLVLFDVTDPSNPMLIDAMVYENCNSAVQTNPKALVYNPDRKDYILPLNEEYWGNIDMDKGEYTESEDNRGGALNFKVENGRLKEIKHIETDHKSVERSTYIGNYIYMTYRDQDDNMQIDSAEYK